MSPSKRRAVTLWPAGEVNWSTRALVSLCTISCLRINQLIRYCIQTNDQPHIAALAIRAFDPFGLVNQRLDEEHAHAAGVLFTMNLLIDIRFLGNGLQPIAVIDHFYLKGVNAS